MNERQNAIFNMLSKSPSISVKELSAELSVSEVTIRKDLNSLENEGLIKRTHGGAVQMASSNINQRIFFRYEEKLKIAREAIKFVEEGETVLIESGSTNAVFAKELALSKKVHIITNSVYIVELLKNNNNTKVTLLGGELQEESQAVVGPMTKLCLSMVIVQKAFVGMDGFSEKLGFTCGDFLRAEVGKEMCGRAEKVIVLAESSKFDNVGVTPIVELSKVNIVVTDKELARDKIDILRRNNIEIISID